MRTSDPLSFRGRQIYDRALNRLHSDTDRMFAWLLAVEYLTAVVWAVLRSPFTWQGMVGAIHPQVFAAGIMGGLIAAPPILLVKRRPGEQVTRYTVAVCQMMMSALLIHVSGGRIETHFHVFVSIAFLSAYRDWKILVPATLVILTDNMVRGIYMPESVYGIAGSAEWRFVEHAAWILFEDAIVIVLTRRSLSEMRTSADRRAKLEETQHQIEETVVRRTADLNRSQLRTASILENALDGIVTINDRGFITEFNPAAEAIFGVSGEEVADKDMAAALLTAEYRDRLRSAIGEYQKSGICLLLNDRLEMNGLRATGEVFPMEITLIPVAFDGQTTFTAFIRDISEHKRLLADLAQAQKLESIGQLAAGVAHEINTPNQYIGDNIRFISESFGSLQQAVGRLRALRESVVKGNATCAEAHGLEAELHGFDLDYLLEEIPKAADGAMEGVGRVASIVRAMKEFSHPGLKVWTTVDINRVIEGTVTISRHEWKRSAKIEMDLDPDLPMLHGHPGELGQVFLNLIINSVHAIRDRYGDDSGQGVIRIETRQVSGQVEVVFGDNGPGIPDAIRPKIFEAFFTTKQVGVGTGQGLSITRRVIEETHGGSIRVVSSDSGAKFILRMPIVDHAEEDIAA